MDATLYTGTGANLTVTNAGPFQPDLVWIKGRSTTFFNNLYDSNRGVNKALFSNDPSAETTYTDRLSAFNANGFSVGAGAGTNSSGDPLVAWQWQAGQGTTSNNTSGSITSTVSVNTTSKFSVVKWTGTGANATVGHGLGTTPSIMIIKDRSNGTTNAYSWYVWVNVFTATEYLILNRTTAKATDGATITNSTLPNSTVISLGTDPYVNGSGDQYVAYCWAAVPGFSQFGSYTGNANADGPFIYTGFRPKWIMLKNASNAAYGWTIWDTSRNPSNVVNLYLQANGAAAEDTFTALDALSNGFKMRTSNESLNQSGGTHIYMAFAETPFKYANAR